LTLPDERQKKTVNPTLKGYKSSCRVEEQTLGIPRESTCPGPGELAFGITIGIFSKKEPGTRTNLKSHIKEAEGFHMWN
jgi:hypothetical protein